MRDTPPDLIVHLLLQAQALLIRRISFEQLHLLMFSSALRLPPSSQRFFLSLQKGCSVSRGAIDCVYARDLRIGYELREEVCACAASRLWKKNVSVSVI